MCEGVGNVPACPQAGNAQQGMSNVQGVVHRRAWCFHQVQTSERVFCLGALLVVCLVKTPSTAEIGHL